LSRRQPQKLQRLKRGKRWILLCSSKFEILNFFELTYLGYNCDVCKCNCRAS
jgi:hypothetical protein